ncbi:DnaJ domain-containing protein [Catenaria anguillulae PL171]|uniref:DnaJ domain-containing protein n=1 Tax=Catenaria anguillulae PL171 TaxID=765915 RepID=A0A1Y2H9N2_9FUNG|nr:DnaJ domain-containing protein [Catenaria anguillulae PL171]
MVSLSRQERLPDLYKVLDVPPTADSDRIRQSYMRHALRSHPDLMCNASKQSIESARAHFALLNQAYFTLSDPHRRAVYDEELAWQRERIEAIEYSFDLCASPVHADSGAEYSALESALQAYLGVNPLVTHMFDKVFEPLIAAEMEAMAKEAGIDALPGTAGSTWSMAGLLSGMVVGFMVASIPGAAFGGVAGYRIGAVRDRTGVPVMQAFSNMSPEQRGKVLRRLAGGPFSKL